MAPCLALRAAAAVSHGKTDWFDCELALIRLDSFCAGKVEAE